MANKSRPIFSTIPFGNGVAPSTFLMDSANDAVAYIFQAGRSSAYDVGYIGAVLNVTAGSPTVRFSIETVTAGAPSGTSVFGGAGYVVVTPVGATPTMYYADMSALPALTLTPGTFYAITIRSNNLAAGTTCTVTHSQPTQNATSLPVVTTQTNGGAWTTTTGRPVCCLLYDAPLMLTPEINFSPIDSFALNSSTQSIDSSSTPDEVGVKWRQQTEDRCVGATLFCLFVSTAALFDLVLYENGTAIKTLSVDPQHLRLVSSAVLNLSFSDDVALHAGNDYILAVRPSTTNYVRVGQVTFPLVPSESTPETLRDVYFGRGYRTSRTNAGSWTDVQGTCPFIIPLIAGDSGADADNPGGGAGFWGA